MGKNAKLQRSYLAVGATKWAFWISCVSQTKGKNQFASFVDKKTQHDKIEFIKALYSLKSILNSICFIFFVHTQELFSMDFFWHPCLSFVQIEGALQLYQFTWCASTEEDWRCVKTWLFISLHCFLFAARRYAPTYISFPPFEMRLLLRMFVTIKTTSRVQWWRVLLIFIPAFHSIQLLQKKKQKQTGTTLRILMIFTVYVFSLIFSAFFLALSLTLGRHCQFVLSLNSLRNFHLLCFYYHFLVLI